jgi:hypothetical protein
MVQSNDDLTDPIASIGLGSVGNTTTNGEAPVRDARP